MLLFKHFHNLSPDLVFLRVVSTSQANLHLKLVFPQLSYDLRDKFCMHSRMLLDFSFVVFPQVMSSDSVVLYRESSRYIVYSYF